MSYSIFVPMAYAAKDVDAWIRNAVSAGALENGNLVKLTTRSATAGEGEVFSSVDPSTANGKTDLWIVNEPVVISTTQGSLVYRGLNQDPRNFQIAAGKIVSVFKPQLGDIYRVSADWFSGAKGGSDTHANITDGQAGFPVWGTSQTASVFSVKLLATTFFSIGTGGIDTQRITAYDVEVVGL
jgi:hypothetical protein